MAAIVYIYVKQEIIRAISHQMALTLENYLLQNGWQHVATIDAADFIEVLCTEHEDEEFRQKFIKYLINKE